MASIEELIEQWLAAKQAESDAEARRVELAAEIAERLGKPSEGSATYREGRYLVKVTQPINRKIDWDVFDQALATYKWKDALVKLKRELATDGLRYLQENQPDIYRELAKAITATPGRVGIEVKEGKP
jgi:hypothetical protein